MVDNTFSGPGTSERGVAPLVAVGMSGHAAASGNAKIEGCGIDRACPAAPAQAVMQRSTVITPGTAAPLRGSVDRFMTLVRQKRSGVARQVPARAGEGRCG